MSVSSTGRYQVAIKNDYSVQAMVGRGYNVCFLTQGLWFGRSSKNWHTERTVSLSSNLILTPMSPGIYQWLHGGQCVKFVMPGPPNPLIFNSISRSVFMTLCLGWLIQDDRIPLILVRWLFYKLYYSYMWNYRLLYTVMFISHRSIDRR